MKALALSCSLRPARGHTRGGWASVEALTENPELLATQAAAVKSPTAQIGITFELEDAGGEIADSHRGRQKLAETKQRIANALDMGGT